MRVVTIFSVVLFLLTACDGGRDELRSSPDIDVPVVAPPRAQAAQSDDAQALFQHFNQYAGEQ